MAISLMAEDEQKALANIEKLTRQTLKPEMMTGFWPSWMEHPKPPPSTSGLCNTSTAFAFGPFDVGESMATSVKPSTA